MIRNILLNLLVLISIAVILIFGAFEGTFSFINILDAFFIVAILSFFIGLLTFSNATEVLRSTGHALKVMFSPRQRDTYKSFYETKTEQDEERKNNTRSTKRTGLATIIASVIIIAIDLILSILLTNNIL